jgi:HK97 family phage portal protein
MLGRLLERRYAFQNLWGSGALFERSTRSGVSVTADTSLALSAVYACVRLISDTISTLPVDQFIRVDGQRRPYRPREEWVVNPNPLHPRTTFYQQVLVSLMLDGNAFVHVMRDDEGVVFALDVLNPTKVEPVMVGRDLMYRHTGPETPAMLPRSDVLHITELLLPGELRGISRIAANKENLGLAMALQEYAATFFGNGAYAGGILEVPGEPNPEQLTQMVDAWEGKHRGLKRAHRPAVLYGGAKFVATGVNPSDSQLLQERMFGVEEVARLFRVPLFALGVSTPGAVSYASVEQQQLHFLTHTIQPVVAVLEDAFSRLLQDRRSFIRFNLSSLVRSDLATRTAAYSTALAAGYMSVNDVRALEDMASIGESGDHYRVPLQNIPTTDTPVITLNERAKALSALITSGFTPQSAAQVVGIEGLEHTGLASVQLQDEVKNPDSGVTPDV